MISSEVQRTLVKSPPELWAELSDPAALARHLGELGEIRITRVEPEQLVEWQAENRTGKVQIKPSAWGTRVTLTVATDLPETSAEVDPASPVGADPMPRTDEPMPTADEPMPTADEPTPRADEPIPTADEATPAPDEPVPTVDDRPEPPATDRPAARAEDEPAGYFESVPSPLGAPLTAAAASSWRTDTEAAPAAAAPERPVEDDAEFAPEATDHEEAGEAYDWQPDEELEPRRGFFARFFDRWRTPMAFDGEAAEEPLETTLPTEAQNEPAPPAGDGAPEIADSPVEEQGTVALEADAAPAELPSIDAPSPNESEPIDEAPVDEKRGEPTADGVAAEPESVSPQLDPAEQGGDIAAELKAAEELADAEVTAVLSSVLDRLGAAHHRPFSRS
jgi:hypothetical protein